MPRLLETSLVASALLAATVLQAASARAEMAESDSAAKQAFIACLDQNSGEEDYCLGKLGQEAWYPRDDAACQAVAARVQEALPILREAQQAKGVGEIVSLYDGREMRDLYFNERCARLGLPHNSESAITPDSPGPRERYETCLAQAQETAKSPEYSCIKKLRGFEFYPAVDEACEILLPDFNEIFEMGIKVSWNTWFRNERCRRWGLAYAEISRLRPVSGLGEDETPVRDVFVSCLDDHREDEEYCIGKFGRHAWYPRNGGVCEETAALIEKILAVNGDPVWRELFKNERCARLGLAHNGRTLPDRRPERSSEDLPGCLEGKLKLDCTEINGAHEWNPEGVSLICEDLAVSPVRYPESQEAWWHYWFQNERCRRLGRAYYDAAANAARLTSAELKR